MKRSRKQARERALVIMQVRGGALTVRDGAARLGVSRKTYYEWEDRALGAMASALENRPVGRPVIPRDEEKEALEERVKELEKKLYLAEKTLEVREMLLAYERFRAGGKKKGKTKARVRKIAEKG
jgi:transposase